MFTPTVPAVSQLAAPLRQNIPALMGLLGVWNISFLDLNVRAVLPYSQVRNTDVWGFLAMVG